MPFFVMCLIKLSLSVVISRGISIVHSQLRTNRCSNSGAYMAKIENYKYTVEEAFSDGFFVIPDYQREYVWQENEVNKLLQDIVDEYDATRDEEYFIGTILVSDSSDKTLEVIDGQQRLTTLFLTVCALKHLLDGAFDSNDLICKKRTAPDGSASVSYRLDLRYEGAEDFCRIISSAPSYDELESRLIEARGKLFGSLENLANAYQSIILFLKNRYSNHEELDIEALLRFWGYLANYVVFIQIKTTVSRALKIFETINERGVSLNSMDLLKNLLFTHVNQDRFGHLKNEWKKITEPLEKHKEKPLRFLRYYLMANYPIKGMGQKKEPIIREDQIYDWLTDKENAELCGYKSDPFLFVRKLAEGVETFINFSNGKDRHGKDSVPLDNLRKLCGGAFSLHFILLLSASKLPDDLFDYLVRQLESFLFYFIVTKSTTRDLERNFSVWADELCGIVAETDKSKQTLALNDFVQRHLKQGAAEKSDEFEDYFKRFSFSSLQQYRLRYVLAKLTQYVDMQFRGVKEARRLDDYLTLEVEHILPNTPESDFKEDFEKANPSHPYDVIKNRLGNLTLLEKPINIAAGRDFFDDKKPLYEKCGNYLTISISNKHSVGKNTSIERINEVLKSYDQWTSAEIEDRQEMLMQIARMIWTIKDYS